MTGDVHRTVPPTGAVLGEQLRFVGLALRREAAIGLAILVVLLFMPGRDAPVNFTRESGLLFAALGIVFPFVLWKGRPGDASLWALPVDHRRHAIVRIVAGWVWLMVAACAVLVWLVALILLTGGEFSIEATRMLLDPSASATGAVDPRDLTAVHWRTPRWLWLIPFSSATLAYLLASALVLATRNVWRWVGGFGLLLFLVLLAGRAARPDWLNAALETITTARFGFETAFAGGATRQSSEITLTTGETIRAWRSLPDFGRWASATLVWLSFAILALWVATIRYREREHDAGRAARQDRA